MMAAFMTGVLVPQIGRIRYLIKSYLRTRMFKVCCTYPIAMPVAMRLVQKVNFKHTNLPVCSRCRLRRTRLRY
jgi:hypothetical protein